MLKENSPPRKELSEKGGGGKPTYQNKSIINLTKLRTKNIHLFRPTDGLTSKTACIYYETYAGSL